MSKPVRLDDVAEREAEEAYTWYERRELGLGERFLAHLARTLEKIQEAPASCSPVPGRFAVSVRAARVGRFPFRLVFVELDDRCLVVAVVHLSQRPGYWAARLEGP